MALNLILSLNARGKSRFVQPLPTLSATIGAAYGLRRIVSSYTGALVRILRDSDNAELDIGYTVNNELDVAAAVAHIGAATGRVVTWYDQSGNAYNVTQATGTIQPFIGGASTVLTRNGRPTVSFTGARYMKALTAATTTHSSGLWTAIGAWSTTSTGIALVADADALPSSRGAQFLRRGSTSIMESIAFDSSGNPFTASAPITADTLTITSAVRNTTVLAPYVNGAVGTTATITGTAGTNFTTMTIGATNGNGNIIQGNISELIFLRGAASATDRRAVEQNMGAYFGIGLASLPNLYTGGDFDSASDLSTLVDASTSPGTYDWVAPGYLRMTRSGGGNVRIDRQISGFVIGVPYRISLDLVQNPAGVTVFVGTAQGANGIGNFGISAGVTGPQTFEFTPTVTNPWFRIFTFADGVTLIDRVSVTQA